MDGKWKEAKEVFALRRQYGWTEGVFVRLLEGFFAGGRCDDVTLAALREYLRTRGEEEVADASELRW